MTHYIYPYLDHVAVGRPVPQEYDVYSLFDYAQTATPKNIPFLLIEESILLNLIKDDEFFDAWTADFSDPDGYGVGMPYEHWLSYKTENSIDNRELINNEINKSKNRSITINMVKARNIWRDKLREERKPLLETLDVQYIRALERGETELIQKIVKKKEFLRDITEDPRIENATNTDNLRTVVIPPNFIEE